MKLHKRILAASCILGTHLSAPAHAQVMQAGDGYELQLEYSTQYRGDSGSGSSNGRDTIVVRLIAERDGGQELEYDHPADAKERDRLRDWQLPARIFVAADGTRTLLNVADLEARRDRFLKAAELPAEACGRWIFTWNAFKIECDPQSAMTITDSFQIQPTRLADGAMFTLPGAAGSGPMACKLQPGGGQLCTVTLPIDVASVRMQYAESDVVSAEISGTPLSLADAVKSREAMTISGTIEIIFEADKTGAVHKRTTVVRMEHSGSDDGHVTSTSTRVLTRRKL